MGRKPNWSKEELDYLMDNWGKRSLHALSAHLGRSEAATKLRVSRLGLGAFLEAGEYISFNELIKVLGREKSSTYMSISWIKKRGFPVKYKHVDKSRFKVVYLTDFWKWAERNRSFVDFSKFEENSLGAEPDWVKEQRKVDQEKSMMIKKTPWTPQDDAELKRLLKTYRYSVAELSRRLQRSCGAIQRRMCDLGVKERPLKADNHVKWTPQEFTLLDQMIQKGTPYTLMVEKLHKSEKAIRGKVFVLYGSENLDRVRERMKKTA